MIWADNDPYFTHANLILPEIADCKLEGNDYAATIINYGKANENGKFDANHLIFAGINNLYEGITICYPNKQEKLQVGCVFQKYLFSDSCNFKLWKAMYFSNGKI
jgi:hypothetical protein